MHPTAILDPGNIDAKVGELYQRAADLRATSNQHYFEGFTLLLQEADLI